MDNTDLKTEAPFVKMSIDVVLTSVISKASGGDFYQGAMSALVVWLYNDSKQEAEAKAQKLKNMGINVGVVQMKPGDENSYYVVDGKMALDWQTRGNPIEKAKITRKISTWSGRLSAGLALIKNPYSIMVSKVLGGLSMVTSYEAHLFDMEAGQFDKNGLMIDVITNSTTYCDNPIGEQFYDEVFGILAPVFFDFNYDF